MGPREASPRRMCAAHLEVISVVVNLPSEVSCGPANCCEVHIPSMTCA